MWFASDLNHEISTCSISFLTEIFGCRIFVLKKGEPIQNLACVFWLSPLFSTYVDIGSLALIWSCKKALDDVRALGQWAWWPLEQTNRRQRRFCWRFHSFFSSFFTQWKYEMAHRHQTFKIVLKMELCCSIAGLFSY